MQEMSEAVVSILDILNLTEVVLLGVGAGADVYLGTVTAAAAAAVSAESVPALASQHNMTYVAV